jgi:FkbM family methyltransferase
MDPWEDSVTAHCYERGWRGVDIEPSPGFAEKLRNARPRDVVVEAAASDVEGTITLYLVRDGDGSFGTGLSTVSDRYAELHVASGRALEPVDVPAVRVDTVLAGTDAEDPDRFHFLKVDVEGHEAAALRGVDLTRFRPIVVLIEAREPDSPVAAYAEAEEIIRSAGYAFVADDGLNRWYVREDRMDLGALLTPEANPITDGHWRRFDEVRRERGLQERVDQLESELAALHERAARDVGRQASAREAAEAEAARLGELVRSMEASRSWRLTAPLRAATRAATGRGQAKDPANQEPPTPL